MPYVGGISTGFNGNSTKKDFETLFPNDLWLFYQPKL